MTQTTPRKLQITKFYKVDFFNPKTGRTVRRAVTTDENRETMTARVLDIIEDGTPIQDLPDSKNDWVVQVVSEEVVEVRYA